MRLLNVRTRCLEEFLGDTIPSYAILSHTWGREEVTFEDLLKEDHKQKYGYRKIDGCCQATVEQRLNYAWIDSCCIDKSSSSELSEAINSMFKWYEDSQICFIFLEDVPTGRDPYHLDSAFRKSRWWTRGWTLQELLAPHHIIWFDSTWERIFTHDLSLELFKKISPPHRSKQSTQQSHNHSEDALSAFTQQISTNPEDGIQAIIQQISTKLITEITGIPNAVLVKQLPLSDVSAACKFAWASQRMTTRIEDKAYCLMGLLDVSLPLLYGEGDKAFVRLQEAVISHSDDISVLAWGYNLTWEAIEELNPDKILARSPVAFSGYLKWNYQHIRSPPSSHSTITGHGLHLELPLLQVNARNRTWIGIIEENIDEYGFERSLTALVLKQKSTKDKNTFERARGCPILKISSSNRRKRLPRAAVPRMIYLQDGFSTLEPTRSNRIHKIPYFSAMSLFTRNNLNPCQYTAELSIFVRSLRNIGYTLSSRYPPINHDLESLILPKPQQWHVKGVEIKNEYNNLYESPFVNLLCQGPGNEYFYYILTNTEGQGVAVKVRITYRPPYIDSYEISLSSCGSTRDITALEVCCGARFGKHTEKQFGKKFQWNSYANLRGANHAKIHISALPSQRKLPNHDMTYAECSLVWSGGWI